MMGRHSGRYCGITGKISEVAGEGERRKHEEEENIFRPLGLGESGWLGNPTGTWGAELT